MHRPALAPVLHDLRRQWVPKNPSPGRSPGAQDFVEKPKLSYLDIHGPKPYEFIGFGSIHCPKPYEFIRFGSIHGPKPSEFIGLAVWGSPQDSAPIPIQTGIICILCYLAGNQPSGPDSGRTATGKALKSVLRPAAGRPEHDFEVFPSRIRPKLGPKVFSLLKPAVLRVRSP